MQGRAALYHVYQKFALSAAATLAFDLQTLIALKFNGGLEGFMRAFDFYILAMSEVPTPDFLYAVLDPQLRNCKQLERAFAHLDGAEPLPAEDRLRFIHKAARRGIENKQRDKTKKDLMRPQSTAIAAAALKAAQVQTAAAKPPARRRRTRSPRNAQTDPATQNSAALAAVSRSPQPLVASVCNSFQKTGKC